MCCVCSEKIRGYSEDSEDSEDSEERGYTGYSGYSEERGYTGYTGKIIRKRDVCPVVCYTDSICATSTNNIIPMFYGYYTSK